MAIKAVLRKTGIIEVLGEFIEGSTSPTFIITNVGNMKVNTIVEDPSLLKPMKCSKTGILYVREIKEVDTFSPEPVNSTITFLNSESVELGWTESDDTYFQQYEVYRSLTPFTD